MVEETKKKEHKKEEKPLEKMTVKELRVIAIEIPRAVAVHDMKKAELIACIKEARGIKDEGPAKIRKKVAEKIKLSKSEIRGKIKQLKEEKKAAQALKDRKKNRYSATSYKSLEEINAQICSCNEIEALSLL